MQQSDDLLNDLPPDARSALLGLIGSTFAELKKVDSHIISRNENVTAMKTDLNKLVREANLLTQPQPQPQVVNLTPAAAPVLQPIPVATSVSTQVAETFTGVDPNQMEFDFYKKITPEDINGKLADINFQLTNIVEKLDRLSTIVTNGFKDR